MSMTIEDFTKRRMRVIMKEPVVEENVLYTEIDPE